MSWFALLYLAFFLYIGWRSVRDSARRHGLAATGLELATSLAWPLLVAAFFWPDLAALLGRWVAPIFALALSWTVYTGWRDNPFNIEDPDVSPVMRRLAYALVAVVGAAIVIPVVVLGGIVVRRAW